jgi:hypothetical protein
MKFSIIWSYKPIIFVLYLHKLDCFDKLSRMLSRIIDILLITNNSSSFLLKNHQRKRLRPNLSTKKLMVFLRVYVLCLLYFRTLCYRNNILSFPDPIRLLLWLLQFLSKFRSNSYIYILFGGCICLVFRSWLNVNHTFYQQYFVEVLS